MADVIQSDPADADQLVELYCKGLRAAGMDKDACAAERRDEFVKWLADRCAAGSLWIMRDDKGPLALAHFEKDKDTIVSVVVRDDVAGKGVATALVNALQCRVNFLKAIPVTRGGTALLKKCEFIDQSKSEGYWLWRREQQTKC